MRDIITILNQESFLLALIYGEEYDSANIKHSVDLRYQVLLPFNDWKVSR